MAASDGRTRRVINARSETAPFRRAFSGALARRRCLVPASGFFEWGSSEVGRERTAHLFRRSDEKPFAIAGLFDGPATAPSAEASSSRPSLQLKLFGDGIETPASPPPSGTFVLLTTRARSGVERVHDRMPVIVDPESFDEWLDPDRPGGPLLERLRDASRDDLVATVVSSRVGDVRNDDPDCIRPVDRLAGSRRGFSG
jgi:putative SOS response-associated peptidase YedK